jgi:hypothetical protein
MKALNSKETTVNQSSLLQSVLKKEKVNIFEKMEKRYGFKMDYHVMICEDRRQGENGYPDCLSYKFGMIPPYDAIDRQKGRFSVTNSCVSSLNELYEVTQTGFNSIKHPTNKKVKKGEPYTILIPVIQISYKRKTYSFRVDNEIIREFFWDTETIIEGSSNKDELKIIERRFLEHMEYLQYFYAPLKSKLSPNLWIKLYFEKAHAGKAKMLISEYLEWKSDNLN